MKRLRPTALAVRGLILGFWFVAGTSCLLSVDLEPLSDGVCAADRKFCDNECILKTKPQTGCASNTCVPCLLKHATANCANNGLCAIAGCLDSYQDCNRISEDGCEIDIDHDPLHCGSCNAVACSTPNGTPDCAAGHCAIRSCKTGFDDCNDEPDDGCEVNLKQDAAHCGTCDNACQSGQFCSGGSCT